MYSVEEKVSKDSIYFFHNPSENSKELFLYPTAIGRFEYLPGYNLERNRYDSFLVILIESGSMEILLDKKLQTAQAGDVVLIDCYMPHAYRTYDGCTALWLHFDGKIARDYYDYLVKEKGNVISVFNFNTVKSCISSILHSFENHSPKGEAKMGITINNILLELINDNEHGAEGTEDGVSKARAYISDNFNRDISLTELSDIAGFSPYYFTRIFKKETGLTPHQFLLATRISAAKYNLSNTNMTIAEIANACGFEDESAFCYSFRKRVGCTPGAFRKT